jgi:CBS-domain-containing membrane protein
MIVPSMGASAVLLFAVPHGKLSTPWALVGGHLVSALIGVACYRYIPYHLLAAGLAVGLAIGAMHILNCIHPPGGATALAAVIGGPAIHQLGYGYMLEPILLNVVVILAVAIAFNYLFPWRRYPVALMQFTEAPTIAAAPARQRVHRHDIIRAMRDMNLVVDVDLGDLQRLIHLSLEHADRKRLTADDILLRHYYTNGRHGPEWSVRHIIDEHRSDDPEHDMVIYRVAEGAGVRSADSCTRREFANWAVREVFNTQRKDERGKMKE